MPTIIYTEQFAVDDYHAAVLELNCFLRNGHYSYATTIHISCRARVSQHNPKPDVYAVDLRCACRRKYIDKSHGKTQGQMIGKQGGNGCTGGTRMKTCP
jgi:hypothetical protein